MTHHDRTTLWLCRLLLFRFAMGGLMHLGREYVYRRAQAQLERGGRSWRVVKDIVKHGNGTVTNKIVESGLTRPGAISLTKSLNRPNGVDYG